MANSRSTIELVIPAQAGIQRGIALDTGLRRCDGV
jgi:hypothetical protein